MNGLDTGGGVIGLDDGGVAGLDGREEGGGDAGLEGLVKLLKELRPLLPDE